MQSTFLPDAVMLAMTLTGFAGGSWVWCILDNLLSSLPLSRDLLLLTDGVQIELGCHILFCLLASRAEILPYVWEKWETWLTASLQIRAAEMLSAAVLMVNIHEPNCANIHVWCIAYSMLLSIPLCKGHPGI